MDDDLLLDELCKARLLRRGYRVAKPAMITGQSAVDAIKLAVADHYGITMQDLAGRKRSANIANARQVAMYLAWTTTGLSTAEVAREFGRTHATVLWAGRVLKRRSDLPQIAEQIASALRGS